MTTASKVKKTVASLKSAQALVQTFATHHPDQNTKQEFSNCEEKLKGIIHAMEERIRQMEFEEPQFKGL